MNNKAKLRQLRKLSIKSFIYLCVYLCAHVACLSEVTQDGRGKSHSKHIEAAKGCAILEKKTETKLRDMILERRETNIKYTEVSK